jgi:hypothetical protein
MRSVAECLNFSSQPSTIMMCPCLCAHAPGAASSLQTSRWASARQKCRGMNRRSEEGRLGQKAEVMLQTAGGPVPAYATYCSSSYLAQHQQQQQQSALQKQQQHLDHLLDSKPGGLEVAMAARQPDILQLDNESSHDVSQLPTPPPLPMPPQPPTKTPLTDNLHTGTKKSGLCRASKKFELKNLRNV